VVVGKEEPTKNYIIIVVASEMGHGIISIVVGECEGISYVRFSGNPGWEGEMEDENRLRAESDRKLDCASGRTEISFSNFKGITVVVVGRKRWVNLPIYGLQSLRFST